MWHVDEASQIQQDQEPGDQENQIHQSQEQKSEEKATQPVVATAPQFGRTNRRIFWSVFLASFLLVLRSHPPLRN